MDDNRIIELYFARNGQAVVETDIKYGTYCRTIARRIVLNREDAEECVNDAYIGVWNAVPPSRPDNLKLFVGVITRNVSLDRLDYNRAAKRGDGIVAAIDELASVLSDGGSPVDDTVALREGVNAFLGGLDRRTRIIFMRRYWYAMPIAEIAEGLKLGERNVRVILHRTRRKFAAYLKKEGLMQ